MPDEILDNPEGREEQAAEGSGIQWLQEFDSEFWLPPRRSTNELLEEEELEDHLDEEAIRDINEDLPIAEDEEEPVQRRPVTRRTARSRPMIWGTAGDVTTSGLGIGGTITSVTAIDPNGNEIRSAPSLESGIYKSAIKLSQPKPEVIDGKVPLFENGVHVMEADAVWINHVQGYFSRNDPRVYKDVLSEVENYIIVSRKYRDYYGNGYAAIVNNINDDGSIDHNTLTYTTCHSDANSSLGKLYAANDSYIPRDNTGNSLTDRLYISKALLDSYIFNTHYTESIRSGVFAHKDYTVRGELEKHKKWMYRKRKMLPWQSFSKYMDNKPRIYNAMFGKKYTFGIEIETSSGLIPERFDNELFYSAVHDGSLRDEEGNAYGGEYVTDVLYGDLGLLQLRRLCNELSKRCQINHRCGLHAHLGNVNFNKENVVLMYHLYQRLEREIFGMLPKSRSGNEYCRKLKPLTFDINNLKGSQRAYYIDYYYNNIIDFLSQQDYCNKKINKKNDHPKGFKCGYDHGSARYCWVNFIPAVFNTRKNGVYTIEFRPHSATTSYKKIKNWLFICIALVDIVENHKADLYNNFNMNLHEIIKAVYPKSYLKLSDYISKRTVKFNNMDMRPEDVEATDYTDNEIENNLSIKNL